MSFGQSLKGLVYPLEFFNMGFTQTSGQCFGYRGFEHIEGIIHDAQ